MINLQDGTISGQDDEVVCGVSPDQQYFGISEEGMITIKQADGTLLHTLETPNHFVCVFSPNNSYVATMGGVNISVYLWNMQNGELIQKHPGKEAIFSADEQKLVISQVNINGLNVWDITSNSLEFEIYEPPTLHDSLNPNCNSCPVFRASDTHGPSFSPDGTHLAYTKNFGTPATGTFTEIKIYNTLDYSLIFPVLGKWGKPYQFSPDNKWFAFYPASGETPIRILDLSTDTITHTLEGHTVGITSLFWLNNSNLVIALEEANPLNFPDYPPGGKVIIWDMQTEEIVFETETGSPVLELYVDTQGQFFVTRHEDNTLVTWRIP